MEEPPPAHAHETRDDAAMRARLSDLVVAYFVRGIDSLAPLPRGRPLSVRRVWAASPELSDGRPGPSPGQGGRRQS